MNIAPRKTSFSSKITVIFLFVGLVVGACGHTTPSAEIPSPTLDEAETPPQQPAVSQQKCGDGICDGPENAQNCPKDCSSSVADEGAATCPEPNPKRALVQDLIGWQNWLVDGGFEESTADIDISNHPQSGLSLGLAERSSEAARTGNFGYVVSTTANQGLTFSIRSYLDKGEGVRFSFWARSLNGEVSLQPSVTWVERGKEEKPTDPFIPEGSFTIGSEWVQVTFETENKSILRYALLNIEVGPNTVLHVDDVQVEQELWQMVEYEGESRLVGGIPVPPEPIATTQITFTMHIEDPSHIQFNESYFQDRTAVFTEVSKLLHQHGGFLTIQPEEDWVMASDQYSPGLLQELAENYGVQYSTHTHGPQCRDDQGRLRSHSDCQQNQEATGWDHSITSSSYPEVIEYIGNQQDLISQASGSPVTDHNGNWEFVEATELSQLGYQTWSAYKSWRTQRSYPYLINNPWRPSQVNADIDTDTWLTHDPNTGIVYIPGWTQTLTRWHERAQEKLAPILSQWISYADPDRVNTFTVMLHVDIFQARHEEDDNAYTLFDETTGTVVLSDEFQSQLDHWDTLLTELIDPLVAEGYLQWTSIPQMGELYREWEQESCGVQSSTTVIPTPMPATGTPDYEPPINVFFVLHIDPTGMQANNSFKVTPEHYQQSHDNILWLMEEAKKHDLNFTALFNGWYPQWALSVGDTSHFQDLLGAGHEVGSHAHRMIYDPGQDLWVGKVNELNRYGRPNYDTELTRQTWNDADKYVDEVLSTIGAPSANQTMCAVAFKASDEGQLMSEFGFTSAAGNRSEKAPNYFGHIVWNPWRASSSDEPGYELAEDLTASYISLDHLAQIDRAQSHSMDVTVPQLQRRFLMLYVEWLVRERTGAEDKVWTFGFVHHPNYGNQHNDAIVEFLTWLDEHFIGKTSPHGNIIARYATVSDIAQEYLDWEEAHPGTSSFNYERDDPYPYTFALMPEMLEGAPYEETVDLDEGVTCFRFSKDGKPIYLIWSDSGERVVDFSAQLSGQVLVTNADGEQSKQESGSLSLSEEPLFIEPTS